MSSQCIKYKTRSKEVSRNAMVPHSLLDDLRRVRTVEVLAPKAAEIDHLGVAMIYVSLLLRSSPFSALGDHPVSLRKLAGDLIKFRNHLFVFSMEINRSKSAILVSRAHEEVIAPSQRFDDINTTYVTTRGSLQIAERVSASDSVLRRSLVLARFSYQTLYDLLDVR